MKLKNIILKNAKDITKDEANYLDASRNEKMFICKNDTNMIYIFELWRNKNDSVVIKKICRNGRQSISSINEIEELKTKGYRIEEK